jgi:hypothetical protein
MTTMYSIHFQDQKHYQIVEECRMMVFFIIANNMYKLRYLIFLALDVLKKMFWF